jgi:hypothetical protein
VKNLKCLGVFFFLYDNKHLNDHIFIRVLLRHLKCIANFFRGSVENPWVRYSLKKGRKVNGQGGAVFIEPWSGGFPKVFGEPLG